MGSGLRQTVFTQSRTCRILDVEPDLADGLSAADRRAAAQALVAPVLEVMQARWEPPDYDPARTFGLLVVDGLLGRRVRVGSAVATELLGCGDILRPWDKPDLWGMVPPELDWRVFRPAQLAVLDERVTALIGRRPELVVNFSSRLLRRARSAAYMLAVSHQTRVDDKLMATLWHLASNWGRVTSAGVSIPFRLTHEVLGEIIGAQRPSVTMALGRLTRQGRITRARDGTFVLVPREPEPSEIDPSATGDRTTGTDTTSDSAIPGGAAWRATSTSS